MSLATRKYENIIIIDDLNIDTENKRKDNSNYLSDLFDIFSLKNLHHTASFQTDLIDCHKLIFTFFKIYFKKLPPKNIDYGNYKILTKIIFFTNLDQNLSKGSICKEKHHQYDVFTKIFRMVLDKHAPIKKKIVRGNEAPFMTKALRKAIMNRSKLKNRYCF